MRPGENYMPNTYAPTPNMATSRVLMACVVYKNLYQMCWDIQKAYTWSKLKGSDIILLEYPKGFERYDPDTGEPLFLIMRRPR